MSTRDGFILDFSGRAAGANLLYFTRDGGANWTLATLPIKSFEAGPAFSDPQHGWLVAGGFVYRTSDAGVTWTRLSTMDTGGTDPYLLRLDFVTPHVGWISSTEASSPLLLKTTDDGQTWRTLTPRLQG